jgi:hypothetical protein
MTLKEQIELGNFVEGYCLLTNANYTLEENEIYWRIRIVHGSYKNREDIGILIKINKPDIYSGIDLKYLTIENFCGPISDETKIAYHYGYAYSMLFEILQKKLGADFNFINIR